MDHSLKYKSNKCHIKYYTDKILCNALTLYNTRSLQSYKFLTVK